MTNKCAKRVHARASACVRAPSRCRCDRWRRRPTAAAPGARGPFGPARLPTWLLIPLLTLSLVGVDVAVDDAEIADEGDAEKNPD